MISFEDSNSTIPVCFICLRSSRFLIVSFASLTLVLASLKRTRHTISLSTPSSVISRKAFSGSSSSSVTDFFISVSRVKRSIYLSIMFLLGGTPMSGAISDINLSQE